MPSRYLERFALLYQLIWRVSHGERNLLEVHSDPLVNRLQLMAKAIRRDLHKMHAFLRFRCMAGDAGERYIAWFEPDHYILKATAQFFVDRFRALNWSILTPGGSLHWDGNALRHGPPGKPSDVPATDAFEAGWGDYYASTYNPARTNVAMMQKEMPKKYWRNMPETKLIPEMLRRADSRVEEMLNNLPQAPRKTMPDRTLASMLDNEVRSLMALNASILASEPFVKGGTRAVLGEGPERPRLMFVGEQPGDQEDLQGRPFVGPAGQLLDRAFEAAGIDRGTSYLTNAVKHFKYEQRGKRRIHQKPTAGEVKRYRWWLDKEIELVAPTLIVALGSTAVLALTGKPLPLMQSRGPATFENRRGFITLHPSYMLRLPDANERAATFESFIADLKNACQVAEAA